MRYAGSSCRIRGPSRHSVWNIAQVILDVLVLLESATYFIVFKKKSRCPWVWFWKVTLALTFGVCAILSSG
ncbi:hypothetical protein BO86DRAFT_54439 [Aspergillus japonicus CBS 114.51]|uniref:Uncharacterized protein n=1 Tax=Aspergillus japonicus CBS 114.51 TaxID=1448312 RepID=A0A8T8X514_ASPJA|nr:hypothetical protein BO86DRAFT_54439 [Aspergillus japonicus CBS 114.51]RAH83237.1 hypothetical protein BO86DRAFT_54439 [Aspergillus japonicus CBS 114.51]